MLAEQLVQILQKSLSDQFGGVGPSQPMKNFDNYDEEIKMSRAQSEMIPKNIAQPGMKPMQAIAASNQPPSEEDEKFHEMVSV